MKEMCLHIQSLLTQTAQVCARGRVWHEGEEHKGRPPALHCSTECPHRDSDRVQRSTYPHLTGRWEESHRHSPRHRVNNRLPHQITQNAFGCAGHGREAGVEEGHVSCNGGGDDEAFRADGLQGSMELCFPLQCHLLVRRGTVVDCNCGFGDFQLLCRSDLHLLHVVLYIRKMLHVPSQVHSHDIKATSLGSGVGCTCLDVHLSCLDDVAGTSKALSNKHWIGR